MDVLLFGITKDIVGQSKITIGDSIKLTSVKELKTHLITLFPDFKNLSSLAIAVNSEYANEEHLLKIGDEIAIIPPVSGG